MEEFLLYKVNPNFSGYQQLIFLYNNLKNCFVETIEISIEEWFSANLCAALGGILDQFSNNFNKITFRIPSQQTLNIFQKNEFLSHFGFNKKNDDNHTTIKYKKLNPEDGRYFNSYINSELLNRKELPEMSSELKKKIAESIYEMFVNAKMHSQSKWVYTCGQFFPQKNIIEFTIVDTGIGFKKNITECFGKPISSEKAIKWAIMNGNSTKKDIPGGIGLAILLEFIKLNKGKLQIISGDGFFSLDQNHRETKTFDGEYPGTIINMQFKTDDNNKYRLNNENYDTDDLF